MEDFTGIVYPPDDAVEYTFVDRDGNVITSYWCSLGEPEEPVYDTGELTDLPPGVQEMGYISEEDLDSTPQPDYHVPPMLYTGPLTVIPTGKFSIGPEDVTITCGRAD